jgi:UDP-N-acetylmuramoylalanine--D-glutamate ligase
VTVELLGKNVVVMGLGKSGRAAAELAASRGAEVVGVDLRADLPPLPGVSLQLGPHRRDTFLSADVVVVSPGVPMTQPDLWAAARNGADVVGELAFALRYLEVPVAAVTGTNGKSTVTWFVGQLLNGAGINAFVGGNLGTPLSSAVSKDWDALVVEVSSYQMEWPGRWSPEIAVVLNLTPDHLGRHGTMDNYGASKCRLFRYMDEEKLAAIPASDERLARLADHAGGGQRIWLGAHPGVVMDGRCAHIRLPECGSGGLSVVDVTLSLDDFRVPGAHNLANAGVAAMIAPSSHGTGGRDRWGLVDKRLQGHQHRRSASGNGGARSPGGGAPGRAGEGQRLRPIRLFSATPSGGDHLRRVWECHRR